jgi:hypothetical protein
MEFVQQSYANHETVRLDPTSDMVARPLLPESPTEVPSCAQDLVSRNCGGTAFFPCATVAADG